MSNSAPLTQREVERRHHSRCLRWEHDLDVQQPVPWTCASCGIAPEGLMLVYRQCCAGHHKWLIQQGGLRFTDTGELTRFALPEYSASFAQNQNREGVDWLCDHCYKQATQQEAP